MTNEAQGLVETKVTDSGMAYPIARVTGSAADQAFGIEAFPTYVLVAPDGSVAWTRGSSGSYEGLIPGLLEQAYFVDPLVGKGYSSINKHIGKREFGKALQAIGKALAKAPEDAELLRGKQELETCLARSFEAAAQKESQGRYAEALHAFEQVADMFDGLERADEAEDRAKAIGKNPAAKDDLAADKLLQRAVESLAVGKKASLNKGYSELEKIVERFGDTPTAEKARALLKGR